MFSIAYGDQPKRGWVRKGSKFSALWDGFCTRRLVDFTLRIGRENSWIHPDRRPAIPDRRDLAPIVPNVSLSRGSSDLLSDALPVQSHGNREAFCEIVRNWTMPTTESAVQGPSAVFMDC
jgi:hypothetical protein